jgi:hypothetical protein
LIYLQDVSSNIQLQLNDLNNKIIGISDLSNLNIAGNLTVGKETSLGGNLTVSGETNLENQLNFYTTSNRNTLSIDSNKFHIYDPTTSTYYDISHTVLIYLQDVSSNIQLQLNDLNNKIIGISDLSNLNIAGNLTVGKETFLGGNLTVGKEITSQSLFLDNSNTNQYLSLNTINPIINPNYNSGLFYNIYNGFSNNEPSFYLDTSNIVNNGSGIYDYFSDPFSTFVNTIVTGNIANPGDVLPFPDNTSVDIFGYFYIPPDIGYKKSTWYFQLSSTSYSYFWIGNNAIQGNNTPSNSNIIAHTTYQIYTIDIELNEGIFYPIRIQYGNNNNDPDNIVSFGFCDEKDYVNIGEIGICYNSFYKGYQFLSNEPATIYNTLIKTGDNIILFSDNSFNNLSSGLVIGPFVNQNLGIRITNNGNIGINLQNPQYTLDVNGGLQTKYPSVMTDLSLNNIGVNNIFIIGSLGRVAVP